MAENNAKSATPSGVSPKPSEAAIPQHKKMAMGIMPPVGKSAKTPA
jgi:hypothetical protein